jgi:hypothetical protein
MTYTYKQPDGKKYVISQRIWNKQFGRRGRWPFTHVELYVADDVIISHYTKTILGKLFMILLTPIILLTSGINSGTIHEIKKEIFDKKYGRFGSDRTYKNKRQSSSWDKIQELIKNKKPRK